MYKFIVIHAAHSGALSVDVFNSKRGTVSPWRVYWTISNASRVRLRAVYAKYPSHVHFFKGWSTLRKEAYRRWGADMCKAGAAALSLDSLSTSGRVGVGHGDR